MSFYPPETSFRQSNTTKNDILKLTDPSMSVEGELKQSILTEHREVSGEFVQSFVIVNDIDVEEELTKTKKETPQNNYFQMLSISFYGKTKSHSQEHQESRTSYQNPTTPQGGFKSIGARKTSAGVVQESKRSPAKTVAKQKPQETLTRFPMKNLQLAPEQRTRMTSPKEGYSPVVAGKNYQVGGKFLVGRTGLSNNKIVESPMQRNQPVKKRNNGSGGQETGMYMKTTQTGRSNSPKGDYQSGNVAANKGQRNQRRAVEDNNEEKTQTLNVEPSRLDIKPHEIETLLEEKEGWRNIITPGKDSRVTSKQSSREGSMKGVKMTTPNHGKSAHPYTPTKVKVNLRDGFEMKTPSVDQDSSKVGIASTGDKTPTSPTKEGKKFEGNKRSPKNGKGSNEKKFLGIVDLQDSDHEEESRLGGKKPLNKNTNNSNKKPSGSKITTTTTIAYKADRQQKSPVAAKIYERVPTAINGGGGGSGIGNWALEPVLMTRETVTSKRGNGSPEPKNPGILASKKSTGQISNTSPKVRKNNSEEKLAKVDVYDQWKGKKFEFGNQSNYHTPKADSSKLKEDKSFKAKDSNERARPTSPISVENKRPMGLLDKLLAQKKVIRDKF